MFTLFTAGITSPAFPESIVLGPDSNLWFAEEAGRIGRITPTGVVTEFTTGITPGSGPAGITVGPDGNLWFTEMQGNRIGRITTAGVVTEFSTGITPGSQPYHITAGPDGNLWFTEADGNQIGRVTTSGSFREFPVPTGSSEWLTGSYSVARSPASTGGEFTSYRRPAESVRSGRRRMPSCTNAP